MIADCGLALNALVDRYLPATLAQKPVRALVGLPTPKTPSRHDALVKKGAELSRDGAKGVALRNSLRAMNDAFEEPKPADEIEKIALWCEREVEATTPDLTAVDAADLLERPFVEPRHLVQHLIPERAMVLLSGDTGSGKTALMSHMAVALACGAPVGGRFETMPAQRVLYLNGEMGADTIARYIREAAVGSGLTISRGRLVLEGADGVANFQYGSHNDALRRLIDQKKPTVVFFDTMRALFAGDENVTEQTRARCAWLQTLRNEFGVTIVLAHHLRKIGPVSNSVRERVAGSRDLIAAQDVHVAAVSRDGVPMHALYLDKTRVPLLGVCTGTEWPVIARLEPGAPNRSIFEIADPSSAAKNASAEDAALSETIARLSAEGVLTIDELNVKSGTRKRAWRRLIADRTVIEVGKRGRRTLYALSPGASAVREADDE